VIIKKNLTPELARLRRALRIEWEEYRYWCDYSLDTIAVLESDAILAGEQELSPLIRAQYIHEIWWSYA
jgi:hypothetical protein